MADEADVPEDRCGFVLEAMSEFYPMWPDVESKEWHEHSEAACCWRRVWDGADTDYCVWHAEVDGKSAEELARERSDGPERLDGAYFRGAEIGGAISFENCRMWASDFSGAEFINVNLRGADLTDSYLRGTNLHEADLEKSILQYANLRSAKLTKANLAASDIHSANLEDSNLMDADLPAAELTEVKATDAWLIRTDFTDANFTDVNLRGTRVIEADLEDASLLRVDFRDAFLGVANLEDAFLHEVNFGSADLNNTNLTGTNISDTDFKNANLVDADLSDAYLRDVDLVGTDLTDADLTDTNLRDADFEAATLEDAVLTRTDIRGADFEYAELYQTLFSDVQMNNRTEFGEKCLYELRDISPQNDSTVSPLEAAAWTYRRIQTLHEENALAQDARQFHVRKAEAYRQLRRREMKEAWGEARENATLDTAREKATAIAGRIRDRDVRGLLADGYSRLKNGILLHVRAATYSVNRWLSRHGESPHRVVGVSLGVVALSTLTYPSFGIRSTEFADGPRLLTYAPAPVADATALPTITDLTTVLGKSLYFSVVTFTTVGYGDLQPVGFAQLLATLESFAGALLMALLVFVLGRRATW